nr:MAG: ORF1 [Torque teno midi virus]UHM27428.1 MAG: ORF1 [Torque teno midi virus]
MPFFWRRRRKLWWGRARWRRNKRRRRYRWPRRRRRTRRPARRRRRKRYKVRRKKKKTLVLRQWQPDRIINCKIKGMGTLILGADGKQMLCYTNERNILTPSRTPGGGGFGMERYTLEYLYEQWAARKNIWTKSNKYTDLCRYMGCTITFYRHQNVDFIINYSRQPPFQLDKYTYMATHPTQMLLGKHKKILQSKLRKTNGREKIKIRIPPPKTMINKWFFQKTFAKADLLQITGTIASFTFPSIGATHQNQILNLYSLNTQFYQSPDWAIATTGKYVPWATTPHDMVFWYPDPKGTDENQKHSYVEVNPTDYNQSVSYSQGWFQPRVLAADKITKKNSATPKYTDAVYQAHLPIVPIRYNMPADTGENNVVYAQTILSHQWTEPTKDSHLIIKNAPIWLALWGLASYLRKHLGEYNALNSYVFVISSPAISYIKTTSTQTIFPLVSPSFITGKGPYNTDANSWNKIFWYPQYIHQEEHLNLICESSPYVPKLEANRESSWELPYTYSFRFKWGGPEITDQQVDNPTDQQTYDEPYTMQQRIQISNPLKQDTDSLLHSWDFRRGIVTQKALERMCSHLETDTDFEPDTGQPPRKKKKVGCELPHPQEAQKEIQACLRSLCEESTSQEQETQSLQQLIQQQKQQQQHLKRNILLLIKDLKLKQKDIQLHTGILN